MGVPSPTMSDTGAIEQLIVELRPKLHRYCARMTGSVVDGEDVVQEVLMNAIEALPRVGNLANPEAWLFRIAHNASLDFLRRRARQDARLSSEDPDMLTDSASEADRAVAAAASLRTFMRLPVAQRSSVILMDVLGYSLQEITGITEASLPAVKAALHRGRERLREFSHEPDDRPPPGLTEPERLLLAAYIERFNARDFDGVRDLLAEEVRLDLVGRVRWSGKPKVSNYLSNYSSRHDWHFTLGFVERRPAIVASAAADAGGESRYFILLDWVGGKVMAIRDFRYARYAVEGAELRVVG
ncbi:MAG TPA: RNA polymerase sigma factor [Gammaproteobacteria bacterium]|nr:RNA polymerase sigma factor [Gammaproteobacteria bacterium]